MNTFLKLSKKFNQLNFKIIPSFEVHKPRILYLAKNRIRNTMLMYDVWSDLGNLICLRYLFISATVKFEIIC